MARRKSTIIDGNVIVTDSDSSIRTALEQAGMENLPPSIVSGGEIITASDFDRPVPANDMLINQRSIKKGALRDRLLDKEFELITRFLSEFPGKPRALEMDDNYLLIGAFPLPDSYATDHVDLLFVISGYYLVPPAGVHIPRDTPNRQQIADHLGGHLMPGTSSHLLDHIPTSSRKSVEELADHFDWVCFHYQDWTWKFNPLNLLSGDCLYKFIENVFAALAGTHK
ncbi:MAG: hypothetical protein ACREYE_17990 [Gammaproteobacteria bacterium]